MEKYLHELKNCALFEGFSSEELMALLPRLGAAEQALTKGEVLFEEGAALRHAAVVLAGYVHICREDSSGKRTLVFGRGPGDLLGEACLFSGMPNLPASAVAARRSRVLLLRGERLLDCAAAGDAGARRLTWNLTRCEARKNLLLNRKIYILSRRTTREKLLAYLTAESERQGATEFVIPYDRQSLADYLGVDRSAMSVEIGKLRAGGLIECEGSRFRLPGQHPAPAPERRPAPPSASH